MASSVEESVKEPQGPTKEPKVADESTVVVGEPSEPTPEDFENAKVENLKEDVAKRDTVESIKSPKSSLLVRDLMLELASARHQKTLQSAEINRLHQQNEMRPKFFGLAAGLAWFIIIVNSLIVGYYVWHAKEIASERVMIFWISSTVLQILGIVYIIAQYLFPSAKEKKKKKKETSLAGKPKRRN